MTLILFTLIGVGLTLGGILMLIRPELFRSIPPEEDVTQRDARISAVVLIFFGICTLSLVFGYGLTPCSPNECNDF